MIQLKEVTVQAAALPGISAAVSSRWWDVTNKLNALITLLERVNQNHRRRRRRRKGRRGSCPECGATDIHEWNIHILAVSEKAFKFKSWQLEVHRQGWHARKGVRGRPAQRNHQGLPAGNPDSLTKDISAVGEGLLSIGGSVVGGVAEGGNMIVGGVGAIGKGISDTGQAIGKGLSDTGEAVADGLNKTTSRLAVSLVSGPSEEPKRKRWLRKRCIVKARRPVF